MFWIIISLSVFVLAVIGSFVLTSQIMNFAVSKQLFDIEDERHTHHHLVPRLGGVVFFPVVVVAFILTTAITQTLGFDQMFLETGAEAMPLAYASCAILLLYIVGLVDDLKGVRYQSKFLAQFICALLLVAGGVVMSDLQGLFFITSLPQWIAVPLTVVLIVFVVNAINLIDGIDGLASGLCILAFLCYGRDEHLLYLDTFFKNHSVRIVRSAFYEQLNPVFRFRTIFERVLQFFDEVRFVLQAVCFSHSCADTRARQHKLIDKHGFALIDFNLIAEFDDVQSKRFRFLSERTFHTISPLSATDMIAPNRNNVNSDLHVLCR